MSRDLDTVSQLLPKLSAQELGTLKLAIEREIQERLARAGADGTLTDEEKAYLQRNDLMGCVNRIRERTGLELPDAVRYMKRARSMP